MKQLKEVWSKLMAGKKMGKDQLLILILSGVLLCIIALPVKESNSSFLMNKSDLSNSNNGIVNNHKKQAEDSITTDAVDAGDFSAYTTFWEAKLQKALSAIEGAGEVQVLITLKESETRILEKDVPEESKETIEGDAEGGTRTVTERRMEETTIYTVNEAGQNVPYVSKILEPVVEGVVVIAQGGDSVSVKQNIIEAIQVLFDMDSNKIRVVKMKTKK